MAIIVDENSKCVIQGITGNVGRMFAAKMKSDGTNVVAGVTPGKGGTLVNDIPVFDSVNQAVKLTGCDVSLVVVPAINVKSACLEAIDAGIKKVIIYTEMVPIHDTIFISHYAKAYGALVLGPNSAGVVSPGKCNVSDINSKFVRQGEIGVVSKSGTLTYEVFDGLGNYGLGISTIVCLGGDPAPVANYPDILRLFKKDNQTKAIVLLGEIGGTQELLALEEIETLNKPVFAYISGIHAPPHRRFGHAGAIANLDEETASHKLDRLRNAGANVARSLEKLIQLIGERFTTIRQND